MGGFGLIQYVDKFFKVVGILVCIGILVDCMVYIGLDGMQVIYFDWEGGVFLLGVYILVEFVKKFNLMLISIIVVLVGLKSCVWVFVVQCVIVDGDGFKEFLMVVLLGVVLDQLWDVVGMGENVLLVVLGMVVVVGLVGLVVVILVSLGEWWCELVILCLVGVCLLDVLWLLCVEGLGVMLCGVLVGLLLLSGLIWVLGLMLVDQFGIVLYFVWLVVGEL